MHTVKLKQEIRSILKRDMVLTISLVLALVSSLFFKPRISYIDFPVLGMLLSFMLVVAGFRQLHVLEKPPASCSPAAVLPGTWGRC